MNSVDQAIENQLKNIQTRSGKTLAELFELIRASSLAKHGEIREMLKRDLTLGHGDANTLAAFYLKSLQPVAADEGDPIAAAVDEMYAGGKAGLRPLHDALMTMVDSLGEFEIAPKKGYLSLRRKRQFAMIGPGSKGRVEVGLNMKTVEGGERLLAQPPGGMCQYKVFVAAAAEVDAELAGWLRQAYDSAG